MTRTPPENWKFILGSRSPRRRELLSQILPAERIEILPPRSADEMGFEELHDWEAIENRILEIARVKCDDVLDQVGTRGEIPVVITADTTVVVTAAAGRLTVLGQPPEDDTWTDVVKTWFVDYYSGRTHWVLTGFCVAVPGRDRVGRVVKTEVTFYPVTSGWIDWYVGTGEPRGKAGGYALQGAGSVPISQIKGSTSNVIGLPLRELLDVFAELNVHVGGN